MARYFIDESDRFSSECVVDNPVNPDGMRIVEIDHTLSGNITDYVLDGSDAVFSPKKQERVVPQEISKAQGIATLMDNGYWQEVNTYFTTQAPPETLTLFNAVTVFNRASPLLLQMQTMLGIPDAEVDQMFIEGATKVI